MSDFLALFFYALPYLMAVGLAVVVILLAVFCTTRPMMAVYPFLLAIFLISDISYGSAAAASVSLLSRGAGVLVFPALIWALLLAFVWIKFAQGFTHRAGAGRLSAPASNLTPWFSAWAVLLCAHVSLALAIDQSFRDAIGSAGFSNLLWVWLMMATMLVAVRNGDDLKWLLRFVLVMGLGRAIFGLVRWAAFGGDPVNAYGNRHGLDLKLTFFDVYDSLICMLTIAIAAMKLFAGTEKGSTARRALLWIAMVVPTLCIVLSFRRTAQLGMVAAGIFLLLQLPKRARWRLALLAVPVGLSGAGYAVWKRLSQTRQAGGGADLLWDITPKTIGPDSPRFLELKLAWASFAEHPVFGVGSWGSYEGWRLVSWQLDAGGGGTYLHSGVLHIGLKSGLVGLVLFLGLIGAFVLHWRRARGVLSGDARALAVAGIVGCIFVIPDFVISTSFTKHRAVLFIGFCASLPYVAVAVTGALRSRAPRAFFGTRVQARGLSGGSAGALAAER